MTTFSLSVHQNEYLPSGSAEVHAIVTIASAGGGALPPPSAGKVVILMGDRSGSMQNPIDPNDQHSMPKIVAARAALSAAIDQISDGTEFAVIAGNHRAECIFPKNGGLAISTVNSRAEARHAVRQLRPDGGTSMSTWLAMARDIFATRGAGIHLGILVTDGKNESEKPEQLQDVLDSCEGKFECDCRGVGVNWDVAEVRNIASRLLGDVGMVRDANAMEADFKGLIGHAMAKQTGDVALRLWAPKTAEVLYVKQVAPAIEDLTRRGSAVSELIREFPTGAWGVEERDYHVCVRVQPAQVGEEMLAARVSLMVGGQNVGQALVRAVWTDDVNLSTRIVPEVAHYTGQAELADAIQGGLAARAAGDNHTATVKLGEAVRLATEAGNTGTVKLLEKVVDVEDPVTGTVRLRVNVDKGDEMELDTRSTKTVRVKKS
jgi:von Willebrand factor type A C-terminal domain/von Willebrand factor type A domain